MADDNWIYLLVRWIGLPMKMEQSIPKRRHIKFRRRGITQKKAYNIQDTAKVWNQEIAWFVQDGFCVWMLCPYDYGLHNRASISL